MFSFDGKAERGLKGGRRPLPLRAGLGTYVRRCGTRVGHVTRGSDDYQGPPAACDMVLSDGLVSTTTTWGSLSQLSLFVFYVGPQGYTISCRQVM